MSASFILRGPDVSRLKVALAQGSAFKVDGIDVSGTPGTTGTPGPAGPAGATGPAGPAGNSVLTNYTVAGVPSATTAGAGAQIYVSNESGGAVVAFSDGTSWRRVTDRAIIS